MAETPLDLQEHQGETHWDVWKRRLLFLLLIGLCVAFAAPTFGSCSGAMGTGGSELWGTFEVNGEKVEVRENDFVRAKTRVGALMSFLGSQERMSDQAVWALLLQDAAARAAGIDVSDEQVQAFLRDRANFVSADGRFDGERYANRIRAFAQVSAVDHEGITWAIRALRRVDVYMSVWAAAYDVPESQAAFEEWRKENVKLTVDWTVEPYAAMAEKARSLPVSDDDLKRIAHLPKIQAMCTVPARRGVEAAYVRLRDLTPENVAAMRDFVRQAGIRADDLAVDKAAWEVFWAHQGAQEAYSEAAWRRWKGTEYRKKLEEWNALPEPRPADLEPKDPAAVPWPETSNEQFQQMWKPLATKEALAQDVLRQMAERAERENASLASLLPEYEKMGVRVAATDEPLPDDELADKFPDGLGKDSDLDQRVRTQFKLPEGDAQFVPKVLTDPIPATRSVLAVEDRGWFVLRWTSLDPARTRDVLEVRDEATKYYREEYRASELARDALQEIQKAVEAVDGVPARREALRTAAEAAGLQVETLRRFNRRTEKRTPPNLGTDATDEAKRAAERIRRRNRVLDDYAGLARHEPGMVRQPILLDEATGAAYLMLLVEKHEPDAIEMDASALRSAVMIRRYQSRGKAQQALTPQELTKRFHLELTPAGKKNFDSKSPSE